MRSGVEGRLNTNANGLGAFRGWRSNFLLLFQMKYRSLHWIMKKCFLMRLTGSVCGGERNCFQYNHWIIWSINGFCDRPSVFMHYVTASSFNASQSKRATGRRLKTGKEKKGIFQLTTGAKRCQWTGKRDTSPVRKKMRGQARWLVTTPWHEWGHHRANVLTHLYNMEGVEMMAEGERTSMSKPWVGASLLLNTAARWWGKVRELHSGWSLETTQCLLQPGINRILCARRTLTEETQGQNNKAFSTLRNLYSAHRDTHVFFRNQMHQTGRAGCLSSEVQRACSSKVFPSS